MIDIKIELVGSDDEKICLCFEHGGKKINSSICWDKLVDIDNIEKTILNHGLNIFDDNREEVIPSIDKNHILSMVEHPLEYSAFEVMCILNEDKIKEDHLLVQTINQVLRDHGLIE